MRGGTRLYTRGNTAVKALQGAVAYELNRFGQGVSFAQIGEQLGVSTTTAWRRFW